MTDQLKDAVRRNYRILGYAVDQLEDDPAGAAKQGLPQARSILEALEAIAYEEGEIDLDRLISEHESDLERITDAGDESDS